MIVIHQERERESWGEEAEIFGCGFRFACNE